MATKISMRFVIDSSVMQAPGPDHPTDERPAGCRAFLHTIYHLSHRVVVTDAILEEYRQHANRFAERWLGRMGRRGKVIRVDPKNIQALEKDVNKLEIDHASLELMLEDLFLIEAALVTDRMIASLDEEVRELFRTAARTLRKLERIVWVNPGRVEERVARWVSQGAQPDEERMLGRRG